MADANEKFGREGITLKRLTDHAGILRMKDREEIRAELDRFEQKFPQLFFSVYADSFEDATTLREYGFWLLNQANFEDVDAGRTNDCGVLLTIDVHAKMMGMTYGYSLLPYLDEDNTFEILSAAHASFLDGKWSEAFGIILNKLTRHLKKKHREVQQDPVFVLGECGQRLRQVMESPSSDRGLRSEQQSFQNEEVME